MLLAAAVQSAESDKVAELFLLPITNLLMEKPTIAIMTMANIISTIVNPVFDLISTGQQSSLV
jgi:hypothetical protein